jgi:transposase
MNNAFWIGVDLGETTFFAALATPGAPPQQWADLPWKEFPMTKQGTRAFCAWARAQLRRNRLAGICAESVYPLAWEWVEWLMGSMRAVSLVNPRFPKDFARAMGVRDKTDRVDACMLALYGQHACPQVRPLRSREQRCLHQLCRLYAAKQTELQACTNRLRKATLTPAVLEEAQCEVTRQERFLELIELEMSRLVQADPQMSQDCTRLQTIPGVGRLTALRVLAELGDLRQYSRGELTALVGLYPRQYASGTSVYRKPRLPKSGNMHLRKALYYPGLVASRYCPTLKSFAVRLRGAGMSKQATICAVMRKLLLLMRALLCANCDYDPKYNDKESDCMID